MFNHRAAIDGRPPLLPRRLISPLRALPPPCREASHHPPGPSPPPPPQPSPSRPPHVDQGPLWDLFPMLPLSEAQATILTPTSAPPYFPALLPEPPPPHGLNFCPTAHT